MLWYSAGGPAIGGLVLGVAGGFGTLLFALLQAGFDSNVATSKALKYTVVYCVIFPIELIGGGILLLFYVVPYLVVAGLVSTLVIRGQSDRLRHRSTRLRHRSTPHGPPYGPPTGGPTYPAPTGPPTSGPPQTGPFFDPREKDDPDEPAF